MEIGTRDLAVAVYTLGVIVTGMSLGAGGRPEITPVILVGAIGLSIGWTVYFNWKVAPQFLQPEEDEEEETEDGSLPTEDVDRTPE